MRTVFFLAAFLAASLAPVAAQAPAPGLPRPAATAVADLGRARADSILRTGKSDAAWFGASFLAAASVDRIDAIVAELKAQLGAFTSIDGAHGDYTAHFEKGTIEVHVHLDATGKIDGLFFKPAKVQTASLEDELRALRPASGTLSYVIVEGPSERASLDAADPLAVGSAFKLAVLAAVRDEVARGHRHWNEIVPLDSAWRSLPGGVLQAWPTGTPLTLATYAAEMISVSDNTAADALARLAGPAALAPYVKRNAPFLTTREAFVLKSTPGASVRAAYLAAPTPGARTAVLRAVDALPLPAISELVSQPILAVEWHYSVRELCALMGRVADLPVMSINPGLADANDFQQVAYKGGSDVGVLNLTTQLTTKRGASVCFSATLNDSEKNVDEIAFTAAYGAVLSVLANR